VAVGLAGIFFFVSRPKITDREPGGAKINTPTQHGSKPSPAVPLNANKPAENSSMRSTPDSGGDTSSQRWPGDGMQMTAHHKGRHGCDGLLTLKASGLQFTCPGDESKSFFVALNDIGRTDNDGIVTTDGSKYHFDKLPGGGKEYAEQLFTDWLARVQIAQDPDQ
jgi:hypothetical protein